MDNETAFFKPANLNKTYVSYDGKNLSVGDTVYQISFIEGTYQPVLFTYKIMDLVQDGRIRIRGEKLVGSMNNVREDIVKPTTVHTNASLLLEEWLSRYIFKYEEEIPKVIEGLKNLILSVNPDYRPDKIEVGKGLSAEEI